MQMEVLPITSSYLPRLPQISTRSKNDYIYVRRPFHYTEPTIISKRKDKVVFVLGSTGTGKSKLAIDLAIQFDGEVVNSDKMQVYEGLSIMTNKVTEEECNGIPHHLISGVHPDADFTASDFCHEATRAIESIVGRGKVPIVAGGSNSYIEQLVDGDGSKFRAKYECCFVWIDVQLPELHSFVSTRVDRMVEMGLVEEARGMFDLELTVDYNSKGIRRSIGMPEMDRYFRCVTKAVSEDEKESMLKRAIDEVKENTCKLTFRQLLKIHRLSKLPGWNVQRIDATEAFQNLSDKGTWERVAREPSVRIVHNFLKAAAGAAAANVQVAMTVGPTYAPSVTLGECEWGWK